MWKYLRIQASAQLEVDRHSSIYTEFTGCTSAYSSAHDSTEVKESSKLAREGADRQLRVQANFNVLRWY